MRNFQGIVLLYSPESSGDFQRCYYTFKLSMESYGMYIILSLMFLCNYQNVNMYI